MNDDDSKTRGRRRRAMIEVVPLWPPIPNKQSRDGVLATGMGATLSTMIDRYISQSIG
jgi:hypothetical protein